jgi:pilus assembly protein CpaB
MVAAGWLVALALVAVLIANERRARRHAELVARACHELRGPLTAAGLALYSAGRRGELPARRVAAVDLQLRRAELALTDLSLAPQGARARDHAEPLAVADLLAAEAECWRDVAWAHGCELVLAEPLPDVRVRADARRLSQAAGNLIANALEHGAGTVRLAARADGSRVRIEVCGRRARPGGANTGAQQTARRPRPRPGDRRRSRSPRRRRAAFSAVGRWRAAGHRAPGGVVSRRRRGFALAALALILGGLAASDVSSREAAIDRRLGPAVPVVVARADLPAGHTIKPADLAVRHVPARYAPAAAFANPSEAAGLRTAAAVVHGTDLVPSLLADGNADGTASLRPGERVSTFVAIAPAKLVQPGGRVDVLVTRAAGDGNSGSTTLSLSGLEVLATSPAENNSQSGEQQVSVSLRVSVRQAVFLAAAGSFAREIRLLPRAADDNGRQAQGLRIGSGL